MAQTVGATHVATSHEEAKELVVRLTRGQLADHAIITADLATAELLRQAVEIIWQGERRGRHQAWRTTTSRPSTCRAGR